jgi:DNA repair exonuclease SbcCD ATPase subunit/DNA repair exonuclease SbcCD nuclease subunit
MRIAHISDIHIRNLKYHSDYRKVFEAFYRKLEELKVDLVVNTGDTAHTKTHISPELVEMVSEFFMNVARICPKITVLGNHDLNLMNEDRQDAITPIIEALSNPSIALWKKSGLYYAPAKPHIYNPMQFAFWNFGIADAANWPRPPYPKDRINIGLFHGSIRNCITDSNFRMTQVDYDTDIFEGLDYVMMGDIHKRQSFNDGRVWYAGSMIQQNFGEDPDKGFLLWDIKDKNDFSVEFHELKGNRRFYTIKLNEDLTVPQAHVEPDSRIRISPPRALTLVEQKAVEKIVKKRYDPHDVITLGVKNIGQHYAEVAGGKETKIENLRQPDVQERLIREFLKPKNLPENIVQKIIDLNRRYQIAVEQRDDVARNVNWRILKMGWSNLYNYGEGNVIDFSQIKGLSGIFAPNASGKSSLIDVITVGAFDSNTKEVAKNINLVNDNKDKAVIILEMLSNHERFTVERVIERIKFGQRRGKEKEWGKTSLDFVRHHDGDVERLVGELRPETEKNIRRKFGSFEDFMLTSLFAQWDPMDLIMCKETERKRILFRFLDLDIFEEKGRLAKDEGKKWIDRLAELEEGGYENAAKELEVRIQETKGRLEKEEENIGIWEQKLSEASAEIERLLEKKVPITVSSEDPQKLIVQRRRVESQVDDAKRRLAEKEIRQQERQDEVGKLTEMIAAADEDKLSTDVKKYTLLTDELFALQATQKDLERRIENRIKKGKLLDEVPCGDNFPTCKFLVDAFESKNQLPVLRAELDAVKARITQVDGDKDQYEYAEPALNEHLDNRERRHAAKSKLDMIELEVENLQLLVEKLMTQFADLGREIDAIQQNRKYIQQNKEIDSEVLILRNLKSEFQEIIRKGRININTLTKNLGSDQSVLQRVNDELSELKEVRDTCTAFEHFTSACGKDGIALQILTQKLPLINEEINKILGSAAEFGVYIDYDPEEQSIRLFLQYGQYKSRLLELGSGAEKFLASIAIRAALLSISNLPRSNMFIIDEGFGKLDPQNLESVQRMFDYLKSVFDHVIVISHSDLMKDMVDNIIDITADDEGYAHVEIGA